MNYEKPGEELLLDGQSERGEREKSILFHSPALVFELRQWISERLKLGGKHKDGFLTIQHIQDYIHEVLFTDPDIIPPELLDMHEATYHLREVSIMTVLRWVHKLGYK